MAHINSAVVICAIMKLFDHNFSNHSNPYLTIIESWADRSFEKWVPGLYFAWLQFSDMERVLSSSKDIWAPLDC